MNSLKEKKKETYYILVRSITYAQAVAHVLRATGIRVQTLKSPKSIENSGCGHAVALRHSVNEAQIILARAGFPPFRVYQTNDGKTFYPYH